MSPVVGLWASVAIGAEPNPPPSEEAGALLREQAVAALHEEAAADALALAREAIRAPDRDWTAYRLYLRAAEAAGLADLAVADLAELRSTDDAADVAWTWWRVHEGALPRDRLEALTSPDARVALAWVLADEGALEEALAALPDGADDPLAARLGLRLRVDLGRSREARRLAKDWLAEHPDRPDALAGLWPGDVDRAVRSARRRALRHVQRELPRRSDPAWLYRALRLLVVADEDEAAAAVADRIAAAGLRRPLGRGRWNQAMRGAMGQTLAMASAPELPRGTPSELHDIVEALETAALQRGEPEIALSAWAQLRERHPGVAASLGHARLLLLLERFDEAAALAREAQQAAVAPAADDLARLDAARQAAELAAALGLEAEALLGARRGEEAVVAAWLARQLDPNPQWAALWMRAHVALGPPEPAPASGLLGVARLDADGATGTREETVAALRHADTLLAASLVTLLAPDDREAWRRRAALHEAAGHRQAAFAAYAVAQGLGASAEAELARLYDGLTRPDLGAIAVVARWGARRAAESVDGADDRVEAAAPERPGRVARVGSPVPDWVARRLDGGTIDGAALDGRAYVLALWASWCGPCRIELPEIAATVTRLRAEGLPVEAVAVSLDDDERAARRAASRDRWDGLVVGWTDDRTGAFRASALPTTLVVGPDGTVVHVQVGYDEGFAARLARVLRKHAE